MSSIKSSKSFTLANDKYALVKLPSTEATAGYTSLELAAYKTRVAQNEGEIVDLKWAHTIIETLRTKGLLGNAKLWVGPNLGVKFRDGTVERYFNLVDSSADSGLQTDALKRPACGILSSNLRATVCDGTDDFVNISEVTSDAVEDNFTVILVAKPFTTKGMPGALGGVQTQTMNYALFATNYNTTAGLGVAINTNGIAVMAHGGGYLPCLARYAGDIEDLAIISILVNNRTPAIYLNSEGATTDNMAADRPLRLGREIHGGGYGYFSGIFHEMVVFNKVLSSDERLLVETLLNSKYQAYEPVAVSQLRLVITSSSGTVGMSELKFRTDSGELVTLSDWGGFIYTAGGTPSSALTNNNTSDLFNASSPVDMYISLPPNTIVTEIHIWSQDNYNGPFNRPNGIIVYSRGSTADEWVLVKDFGVIDSSFWGAGSRTLTL